MPRSKKISQAQLARELGLSQAMVSLVLNGRRQGISPETYDRIWAHAVKRGYHPKGMRLASSPAAQGRQAAELIAGMLKDPAGFKTRADAPDHFQIAVNKNVADQIGVEIPDSVSRRAAFVYQPEK